MSAPFTRVRRIFLAGVSLALSAWMLRSPVAQALITRGDDYLYAGNRYQAVMHYRRSVLFDPDSEVAADRIAFVSALERTHSNIGAGIDAATSYLRRHPNSALLLADRALCNLKLRRFEPAFRDFYRAAALDRNAQTYTFAGWAARRAGHRTLAAQMWRKALSLSPRYMPALTALREQL